MKAFVLVIFLASVVNGELETALTQTNARVPLGTKTISPLASPAKQDVYYQPVQLQQHYQQPQQQYIPVQLVQAPLYNTHQPQAAMIIIAQPTVNPQQVLYSSATQQLLNYFNSNPQAKYQLLQGYQQQGYQQQPVHQYVSQPMPVQPAYTYQVIQPAHAQPQPQYQLNPVTQLSQVQPAAHQQADSSVSTQQASAPTYPAFNQGTPYHQVPNFSSGIYGPLAGSQLSHISTLAQLTAQKYLPPYRTAAPIITGLENFTPEQQAQIKAQLSSGGPITPLQSNALAGANLNAQQISKAQAQASPNTGPQEFTPSEEDKSTAAQLQTANGYNSGILYRNQFNKG